MPDLDDISDEYVAQLLTKDARDLASRSSRIGRHDLLLKRPTVNAPKPNTRFLKSIIKETDSHNTALRAKEAQESRARLQSLNHDFQGRHDRSTQEADRHLPKRRRLDRSRSRDRGHEGYKPLRRSREDSRRLERSESPLRKGRTRSAYDEERSESHHAHAERRRNRSKDGRDDMTRHHRRSHHSRHTSSRSNDSKQYHTNSSRRRSKATTADYDDSQDASRDHRSSAHRGESKHMDREKEGHRGHLESRDESPSVDSDPLESIVGPAPPPSKPLIKARGRGALNASSHSAMDAHFAQNYDPAEDAHPDPDVETDDWDQALEALRDRRKWQQRGAERLRAAGFSEDEVTKWTKGSGRGAAGEKDEADVRWKGRGESREWDRGKVVTADGISTQAEWGRLS